jgi:hypothetical protein
MFHLCFQTYVASVFIWMLHIFHTYVASVCFRCFSYFRHMLQVFYLNFAYVAVTTHMLKAYVRNVSSVLDVCCSKSSMLQVFHEAQAVSRAHAVPTGQASARGATG